MHVQGQDSEIWGPESAPFLTPCDFRKVYGIVRETGRRLVPGSAIYWFSGHGKVASTLLSLSFLIWKMQVNILQHSIVG